MSTNFEDLILRDTRANQPAAGIPGRLYYVTDENVTERDNGSAWQDVSDTGGGGGGGNTPLAQVTLTSGDITMNNSGGFATLSTSLDLTIAAVAGDVLGINMAAILDTPSGSGNWTAFDAVTRVSGSDTNYVSNGTGTPATLGVTAWFRWEIAETLSGEWLYTVQSGDVSGGNVTLRFKYKSGSAANRTFRAASGQAAMVFVKNYKQ